MSTVLPTLSVGISKSSTVTPKVAQLKQKMGDGYSSVTPLGINSLTYDATLVWNYLSQTDFNTLWTWVKTNWPAGTAVLLNLTQIDPSSPPSAYFVITDFNFNTSEAGHLHNATLKLEQVFYT
jgi:hypothetical protein